MYIGIDLHKKICYATLVNEDGDVQGSRKFMNNPEGVREFAASVSAGDHVAMEASTYWYQLYDALEEKGVDVCIAHPLKTRAIAEARIKTDKVDSIILAQLLRTNFLPKSYVPPRDMRELRTLVRHRASLARLRNEVKNKVHAVLARNGVQHEFSDLFCKKGIRFLRTLELDAMDVILLTSKLNIIESINTEIERVSKHIALLAKDREDVRLLMSVPGIDYYSALILVSEIVDVNRFSSSKKLCSWAGLVPITHQSGSTQWSGRITKQGSRWLRWILVQIAHQTVRHEGRLREYYYRLARRKGSKIAIVACARKLLSWIYWMLRRNETYRDGREELTDSKLHRMTATAKPYQAPPSAQVLSRMENVISEEVIPT